MRTYYILALILISLIPNKFTSLSSKEIKQPFDQCNDADYWIHLFKDVKRDIYYSQLGEDIILSLLFDNDTGFYVDAGAYHPISSSTTYYFYLLGWRGISIEPIKKLHRLRLKIRPNDINLNVALSDKEGKMLFHEVEGGAKQESTLSTKVAKNLKARKEKITTYYVPTKTLNQILAKHAPKEIDFIKIDIEAWEDRVIKHFDFDQFRPKAFCIEVHDSTYKVVLKTLEKAGYQYLLSDGSNLYFIDRKRSKLVKKFNNIKSVYTVFRRIAKKTNPNCSK